MRQLARIITHRAHKPIRRRLPHRIEQAAHDVQKDAPDVRAVEDVDFAEARGLDELAGVFPIKIQREGWEEKIRSDMVLRARGWEERTFDKNTPMCGRQRP